ncbi:MAG: hypothetical protein AW07_01153 [Candidatus Accumulibacter sp. SK-11]|nr:MAG: hypothetical protein AW07_01153 [Candidatus Accumulibacter sp. SK-11]
MIDFRRIAGEVLVPDRLLGPEVVDGIVGEFIEHLLELRDVRSEGDMAGEDVDELHQSAVLFVDFRQAGVEAFVPRQKIDGVHRLSVAGSGCLWARRVGMRQPTAACRRT